MFTCVCACVDVYVCISLFLSVLESPLFGLPSSLFVLVPFTFFTLFFFFFYFFFFSHSLTLSVTQKTTNQHIHSHSITYTTDTQPAYSLTQLTHPPVCTLKHTYIHTHILCVSLCVICSGGSACVYTARHAPTSMKIAWNASTHVNNAVVSTPLSCALHTLPLTLVGLDHSHIIFIVETSPPQPLRPPVLFLLHVLLLPLCS
jgi:hypothetical protein